MTESLTERLDGYEYQNLLGSSGLAVTYRAFSNVDRSEVVVKNLRSYFAQENEIADAYFAELNGVRELANESVVAPIDFRKTNRGIWVVYPYTDWDTLDKLLITGALTPQDASRVSESLARTLEDLHAAGITHRNLKPQNVFVGPDWTVRLGDVGAAVLGEKAHLLIRATLRTPNPIYAAPEQSLRLPASYVSDVYSMGVLMYEMLTGAPLFSVIGTAAVLTLQKEDNYVDASVRATHLPKAVDQVLRRALSYQPADRYQSAGDFHRALTKALGTDRLPQNELSESSPVNHSTHVKYDAPPVSSSDSAPIVAPADSIYSSELSVYCPSCGTANHQELAYCSHCWAALRGWNAKRHATQEEAQRFLKRISRELLRKKILLVFLLLSLISGTSVLMVKEFVDFPVPKPVGDTNIVLRAGSWAVHGRDYGHSAAVPSGSNLLGEMAWKLSTTGHMLSEPAIVDGIVYQTTGDRRILALDGQNGHVLWEVAATGPVYASPAVTETTVYVGMLDARLLALNRKTGEFMWSFKADGPIFAPGVVYDGVVYLSDWRGTIYGIDDVTGQELWRYETNELVLEPPLILEGDVEAIIISGFSGRSYIVDRKTGSLRLDYDSGQPVMTPPVLAGEYLLLSTRWGGIFAIDWKETKRRFEDTAFYWKMNFYVWGLRSTPPTPDGFVWATGFGRNLEVWAPAIKDDIAYAVLSDGTLHAVAISDGKKLWKYESGSPSKSAAVVVGDLVYMGNNSGEIHVVDRHSGKNVQTFSQSEALQGQLVWGDDMLYSATQEGNLVAFR